MVSLQDRARDHLQEQLERGIDELSTDSLTASLTTSAPDRTRRINTTLLSFLEIVLMILFWVSTFVIPELCKGKSCFHEAFSIILYVAAVVWLIQFLLDRYYSKQHYLQRLYGYEKFSRDTHGLRKVPLFLASAEMAVLLIASQVVAEHCGIKCKSLSRENVLQIIISIMSAAQIILLTIYFIKTVQFNRSNSLPDLFQDELLAGSLDRDVNSSDIGFRDEHLLEQLLERQQDVIRYYKHHNAQLSMRLVGLSDENRSLKIGRG